MSKRDSYKKLTEKYNRHLEKISNGELKSSDYKLRKKHKDKEGIIEAHNKLRDVANKYDFERHDGLKNTFDAFKQNVKDNKRERLEQAVQSHRDRQNDYEKIAGLLKMRNARREKERLREERDTALVYKAQKDAYDIQIMNEQDQFQQAYLNDLNAKNSRVDKLKADLFANSITPQMYNKDGVLVEAPTYTPQLNQARTSTSIGSYMQGTARRNKGGEWTAAERRKYMIALRV